MASNPYKPFHVNLALFCGKDRQKLVKDITRDVVKYGESTAIVAGQRMGKTTLLHKMKEELSKQHQVLALFIDAQARTKIDCSDDSFTWLATYAGVKSCGYSDFGRAIRAKCIREGAYSKVVFLIDEFDAFGTYSWHRHFFDNLRSLLTNSPEIRENIAVVVSGSRKLERLLLGGAGSPLGNVLSWRYLDLLDNEDTRRLVNDPTDGAVSLDNQQLIFRKTGGQPYFVQALMSKLFEVRDEDFADSFSVAEKELVSRHEGTFRAWWESHLTEDERNVFYVISGRGTASLDELRNDLPGSAVGNATRVLAYMGFIRRTPSGVFTLGGSILSDWVKENR